MGPRWRSHLVQAVRSFASENHLFDGQSVEQITSYNGWHSLQEYFDGMTLATPNEADPQAKLGLTVSFQPFDTLVH